MPFAGSGVVRARRTPISINQVPRSEHILMKSTKLSKLALNYTPVYTLVEEFNAFLYFPVL